MRDSVAASETTFFLMWFNFENCFSNLYFKNTYVSRPLKWVICYRQIEHAYTDTTMFVESFHDKLKVGLSPSKKNCVICFIESPLKMMKNAFYFILKALFVLKIFKFLS